MRAAIVRAVEARVALPHAAVEVTVEDLRIRGGVAGAGLRATPDAGSRAGGPMRFILHAADAGAPSRASARGSGRRMPSSGCGRATRGRRARSAPGTIVAPADVAAVDRRSRARAAAAAAAGRTRSSARGCAATVAAGGAIAADAVTAAPLVRSGDEVTTIVRVGPVVAQGRATALEDGALGAIVRVQIEKRRLRGRVRGAGEVEITP